MPRKFKRASTAVRTHMQPVRLTVEERERCEAIIDARGGTISDILRAGIGALERELAAPKPYLGDHDCQANRDNQGYCHTCGRAVPA